MNGTGRLDTISAETVPQSRPERAQSRSRPVHFELVSYRGEIFGPYPTAEAAADAARAKWPDQEQDEERTGAGWDIQVAGARD